MRFFALTALTLTACGTMTITARDSLAPVMLGPVHYVGPNVGKLGHGSERRTYDAEYDLASRGGANYFASQLDMTIPHGLELALADTPPDFMVMVRGPIDCKLTHMFGVVLNLVTNTCRVETQQITPKIPIDNGKLW